VEIVNYYCAFLEGINFFSEFNSINNFWGTFHENENAVGKNGFAGQADNN